MLFRSEAVGAGRPVRRWRDPRDPAPALQPLLHQGDARHGDGRLHRAIHPPAEPGHGRHGWLGDEQEPWQLGEVI